MKRKAFIGSLLVILLYIGSATEASAHRYGCRGGRGYGYGYYGPRVWVAPPRPIVIAGPGYGYYHRPYYARPRYHRGYYNRPYRRW